MERYFWCCHKRRSGVSGEYHEPSREYRLMSGCGVTSGRHIMASLCFKWMARDRMTVCGQCWRDQWSRHKELRDKETMIDAESRTSLFLTMRHLTIAPEISEFGVKLRISHSCSKAKRKKKRKSVPCCEKSRVIVWAKYKDFNLFTNLFYGVWQLERLLDINFEITRTHW